MSLMHLVHFFMDVVVPLGDGVFNINFNCVDISLQLLPLLLNLFLDNFFLFLHKRLDVHLNLLFHAVLSVRKVPVVLVTFKGALHLVVCFRVSFLHHNSELSDHFKGCGIVSELRAHFFFNLFVKYESFDYFIILLLVGGLIVFDHPKD